MNERSKRDEVWGYLGKAKRRGEKKMIEDNALSQGLGDRESYGLVPNQTLNLLNKERFFDMISCNSHARRDFVSNPKTLKRRVMVVGIVMLLLSPFLVIFVLVFRFLGHAELFYNHPTTTSSQRWSNLTKWIFRESNEKAIYSVATCFGMLLILEL